MSTVSSRAVGAVVGSLIADSAGLPIHWIYNTADLQAVVSQYDKPEFIPEGKCPYYKLSTGSFSCYGDQAYVTLKSLVENKGLNVDSYKASLKEFFGPGTAYDIDHAGPKPINGPWINHSLVTFLENYKEGNGETGDAASKDMDGVCKVAPLVALYAGDPKLMEHVETLVRITQVNEIAVKFALAGAKLLESFILNGRNPKAVEDLMAGTEDPEIKAAMQDVLATKDRPHAEVVQKNGMSCAMPPSFKNSLHCLLNATEDYADSLRPTMVAGGDNCCRLCFAGACLGAQAGADSVPADWLSKTTKGGEVQDLAQALIKLRK